jgi:hypothetical protein
VARRLERNGIIYRADQAALLDEDELVEAAAEGRCRCARCWSE